MRLIVVASVSVCACGFDPHHTSVTPDDAPVVQPDTPTDGMPRYHATAVQFEKAGNDFISTGVLMNTTNSGKGTYSAWFHFTGGDGEREMLSVAMTIGIGGVVREPSGHFRFALPNCAGAPELDMQSRGSYTTTGGWVHLLASWDLDAGKAQLYVDDLEDRMTSATVNGGVICYDAGKWGIGGLSDGELDAGVADLYAALGTFIDLDVEANRRHFRDPDGYPVPLGDHCELPAGQVPTGCFIGPVGMWNTNKGSGAGFTLSGDGLTLAPTSPSD